MFFLHLVAGYGDVKVSISKAVVTMVMCGGVTFNHHGATGALEHWDLFVSLPNQISLFSKIYKKEGARAF